MRPVPLDEVVFKQQCFGFGIRKRDFDSRYLLHHCRGLWILVPAMKVTRYTLLKIARLADVNHFVFRIQHAVHTGPVRQATQESLRIEWLVVAHLSNSAFAFEKTLANISLVRRLVLVL